MFKYLFRFIGWLFKCAWRVVDFVRRTAVNLVLLVLVAFIVLALLRPTPDVPRGAALVLRPAGALVEQAAQADPLALLRASTVADQTALPDLLEAVRAARDDERIAALVLETDNLGGGGLSKLAELRAAIAAFKTSGKPVLARGERFSQNQYYLASVADEVHVSPDGYVLLNGLARYVTYFKGALDALGIKMHVFRVGEYKSFSEPFTRTDMSDEDRAASKDLLDGLWNIFREDIAATRKLTPEALERYVTNYRDALAASAGDAAQAAKAAGLVDKLSTRDQWRTQLIGSIGADAAGKDFRQIEADDYLVNARHKMRKDPSHRIAVLVAQGAIVDGEQSNGTVGGETFTRQIRDAREDSSVKAVVLRIDSPGGSAWASEQIRRELELTRQAGKPVVASMSSVAASGGYWIAAGADEIWAAPATVTGSIGIFALFPEFGEPLNRLGITIDGVATAPLAGALDPRRPLDPAAAEALQLVIDNGYKRFLDTVAKARGMKTEEVDPIARGRVWIGAAAAKLGLVDQLGGLDDAVAAAAKRAKLEQYEVVWPAVGGSRSQRLLQHLLGRIGIETAPAVPANAPVAQMLNGLRTAADELLRWNDPQNLYTHCLCEAP